jgi:hypothetical protein
VAALPRRSTPEKIMTSRLDHVRYVSPHGGSDTDNDGTSWDRPFATILAAYDALPDLGGTIFVEEGSKIGPNDTDGLYILGPHDPNFRLFVETWAA